MRILFLLTQDLDSPSGNGRFLPLAVELSRLGHTVRLAATHASFARLPTKEQQIGEVAVRYVAQSHVYKDGSLKGYPGPVRLIWNSFFSTLQLAWAALSKPVDLIYVCKPQPMNSIAGLIGRLRWACPLVVDVDDDEVATGNFNGAWQRSLVAWFAAGAPKWASWVTTNTHVMAGRLEKQGIPARNIMYLPNGTDPSRFAPVETQSLDELQRRLNLNGRVVIAYIGSLSLVNHPVDLLLAAFEHVRRELPSAALLLVGGGEDYQILQEQVKRRELADVVTFCGHVSADAVNRYYRLAHVSVDPVYDNDVARCRCPLKMFESWACGVPFVTADVGDRRILAGDPPAALLAAPGSPGALAEALLAVLKDPQLACSLVKAAEERLLLFRWDVLAGGFEQDLLKRVH